MSQTGAKGWNTDVAQWPCRLEANTLRHPIEVMIAFPSPPHRVKRASFPCLRRDDFSPSSRFAHKVGCLISKYNNGINRGFLGGFVLSAVTRISKNHRSSASAHLSCIASSSYRCRASLNLFRLRKRREHDPSIVFLFWSQAWHQSSPCRLTAVKQSIEQLLFFSLLA